MTDDDRHAGGGRTTLVQNGPFRVELCGCGTLHLTIGAVTLRLQAAALDPLAETLLRAADRLPFAATASATTQTTH